MKKIPFEINNCCNLNKNILLFKTTLDCVCACVRPCVCVFGTNIEGTTDRLPGMGVVHITIEYQIREGGC